MAELNAKQMRQLLQSISTDPQLKRSKDSILLAEDQYPEILDAIFTRLTTPTTLQNTINLLQWERKAGGSYDAELKTTTINSQNYLRRQYEFTPTVDNPWDTYTFRQWKYFITNICLSAAQEALKNGDTAKSMQHLFAPDRTASVAGAHTSTRKNVQGMLLYNPILLDSPWQAPDDLDKQIEKLLLTNEPALVARTLHTTTATSFDKDNALKQIDALTTSIKQTLLRVYTLTSHSFHVLLRELIPKARYDQSSLFTHIKGARTEHMLNLREYFNQVSKAKSGVTVVTKLTAEQLKPHSASHTLAFIESEYVEKDDDAPHFTWSDILTATRQSKMTVYAWVDSFTLLKLRYGDTVKTITKVRATKINKIISKQITDDEKLIIATLNTGYSAVDINEGNYTFTDLVKLLAQNVTSFNKRYAATEHPRISKYLRTRALKYKHVLDLANNVPKGKGHPAKRQKTQGTSQRAWAYLEEPVTPRLSAPPSYPKGKGFGKGKGKGKGKSKDKGKGKGKTSPSTYGKGKGKGKSKDKGKSLLAPKGKGAPKGVLPGISQAYVRPDASAIKCHFCHAIGHMKSNCRKWLALSQSEQYQQRNTHEAKYQLIYDHLEDSVLAPRYCQYCSDTNCDGQNCESPFDYNDYNEASTFFTQSLSHLVVNAKLDRPLDSHAPQTEQMYYYHDDDWGTQHEHEDENQWEEMDESYPAEETYEAYPTEAEDPEYELQDSEEDQDHMPDEDDQDEYE